MTTTEKDVALIPTTPAEVAKALIYIALSALGILTVALADDHLSAFEIIQATILVVGAVPVYLLAGTIPKTIAAFVAAGLSAVAILLADVANLGDITLASWLTVIVGAFAAIGVAVVPNGSKPGPLAVVSTYTPAAAIDVQQVIDQSSARMDGYVLGKHGLKAPGDDSTIA